jgi:hypothetical protein
MASVAFAHMSASCATDKTITDSHQTATFYIDKAYWASRLNAAATDGNIVKTVQIPVFSLEQAIEEHRATVVI